MTYRAHRPRSLICVFDGVGPWLVGCSSSSNPHRRDLGVAQDVAKRTADVVYSESVFLLVTVNPLPDLLGWLEMIQIGAFNLCQPHGNLPGTTLAKHKNADRHRKADRSSHPTH
jgi:hypothetical protein